MCSWRRRKTKANIRFWTLKMFNIFIHSHKVDRVIFFCRSYFNKFKLIFRNSQTFSFSSFQKLSSYRLSAVLFIWVFFFFYKCIQRISRILPLLSRSFFFFDINNIQVSSWLNNNKTSFINDICFKFSCVFLLFFKVWK